tara:strand:- start:1849 stop:2658 length:810 start_codon:yes stop_codon:yes gene_type:complete
MAAIDKIRIGDIDIAYRWDGPENGPVIVMAHAMGTSHKLWDWQVPALSDRYRILRYDFRGAGDTDAPEGRYTLAQFDSDAVGLLDAFGLDTVHWVGISTGGMIGQGLGIHHPERVHSLSLCCTLSYTEPEHRVWIDKRQELVRRAGMVPVWDATDRYWFTDAFAEAANADYHKVREVFVSTKIPGYIGGTSAVASLSYRDELHKITTPTNIIGSKGDPAAPIECTYAIHERIQGSTLTVIEDQHHFPNVEVPEEFNSILREGLDRFVDG